MEDIKYLTKAKYDSDGKCIYEKYRNGMEMWTSYDEHGNIISKHSSTGYGYKSKFDENNNEIHREYEDGLKMRFEYDEDNNMIKYTDNHHGWECYEYNDNGQETFRRNSTGEVRISRYDKKGRLYFYHMYDEQSEYFNIVDSKNKMRHILEKRDGKICKEVHMKKISKNIVYSIDKNGKKIWTYIDDDGDRVLSIDSENNFIFNARNEDGDIFYRNENGVSEYSEYDDFGRLVHETHSDGFESWFKYIGETDLVSSYKDTDGHKFVAKMVDK